MRLVEAKLRTPEVVPLVQEMVRKVVQVIAPPAPPPPEREVEPEPEPEAAPWREPEAPPRDEKGGRKRCAEGSGREVVLQVRPSPTANPLLQPPCSISRSSRCAPRSQTALCRKACSRARAGVQLGVVEGRVLPDDDQGGPVVCGARLHLRLDAAHGGERERAGVHAQRLLQSQQPLRLCQRAQGRDCRAQGAWPARRRRLRAQPPLRAAPGREWRVQPRASPLYLCCAAPAPLSGLLL